MDMLDLPKQWGWIGCDGKDNLEKLIKVMDESDPRLPFGYIKLDEMASRAKINTPPLRALMSAMHELLEMGRKSSRGKLYLETHKPKDGDFVNDAIKAIVEQFDAGMTQSSVDESEISPNDVIGRVFGLEHSGRVRE